MAIQLQNESAQYQMANSNSKLTLNKDVSMTALSTLSQANDKKRHEALKLIVREKDKEILQYINTISGLNK